MNTDITTANNKINGMIFTLSSRTKCLKLSLQSLYKYYNNKHNYPVYIYYFDDIYNEDYIKDIHDNISKNIHFQQIDYGIPDFINDKELFMNRTNNYAKHFTKERIGYLHMIHFFVNSYYYPKTHMHLYDYCFHFDDETLWTKDIEIDFFEELNKHNRLIGSFNTYYYPAQGANQNVRDTTEELFEFCNYYIKKYNISKKNTKAFKAFESKDNFYKDYFLITDSQIYNTNFFKLPEWKQWITEINSSGMIYKARWGDHELNGLFWAIHFDTEYLSLCNTNRNGIGDASVLGINCSALRGIQGIAPGVKNTYKTINKKELSYAFHN